MPCLAGRVASVRARITVRARSGPGVKITALDENVCLAWIAPERRNLAPQPAPTEISVEVIHGLPLDDPPADRIVADREGHDLDLSPYLDQKLRHTGSPLTHVNGYRQSVHENALS